jgi:hypothetical protein
MRPIVEQAAGFVNQGSRQDAIHGKDERQEK